MNPFRAAALAGIRLYQRYISPRKGFCCAYRRRTGRAGCSELGYRAIRRFGLVRGWMVLRERLARCADTPRQAPPRFTPRPVALRGDCDVIPDLDCDLPSGKFLHSVADALDCSCGAFDLLPWSSSRDSNDRRQGCCGWSAKRTRKKTQASGKGETEFR